MALFEQIRTRVHNIVIREAVIEDVLPANMVYQEASASPAPTVLAPAGRVLRWVESYVPRDGITVTYRVAPREVGRHPANVSAAVTWTNSLGVVGSFIYPLPYVDVRRRATVTATATATGTPTVTVTTTPTDTPSATATPTGVPSPTRPTPPATTLPARPVFLPALRSLRAAGSW